MSFDQDFSQFLFSIRNPILDGIFTFFSIIGDKMLVWILLALIFLLIARNWYFILSFFVGAGSVYVINSVIKHIVQRERPFTQDPTLIPLLTESSYSFPSGHASSSFLAATIISYYFPKFRVVLFILAAIIAFSRVYVGVHYLTDVLAGAIEGVVIGLIVCWVITKIFKKARRA